MIETKNEKTVIVADKVTEQRHWYVDTIRVFAIFMVILLHCIGDYYIDTENYGKTLWWGTSLLNEVARTGVPLFFMISGFLLLNSHGTYNIKEFYKKRFSKIGITFLIYNAFYYCYFKVTNDRPIISVDFFKELFETGSAYHLWFMYSLFVLYLFMPFVKIVVDRCSIKTLLLFFGLIIFQTTLKPLANTIFADKLYFYITDDGFVGYLGYMILGYILGKIDVPKKYRYCLYAVGAISFAVFSFINFSSAMNNGIFLFNGGYSANHYIEAAAVFVLIKNITVKSNRFLHIISDLSFEAYLIHVFILEEIKTHLRIFKPSIFMITCFVSTVVLSFAWAYLTNYCNKKFRQIRGNYSKTKGS